jgi:hypothetical protein
MLRFGPKIEINLEAYAREIARFRNLADDLEKLANGNWPDTLQNPDAPLLEQRRLVVASVPVFVGFATGHPRLTGIRREIITSEIIAHSAQLGWARTKSRWYRLGPSATKMRGKNQ